MSEASNGDGAEGSLNDFENNQNKKDSEKNRREQENLCIEELAMLISAQIPELSDSDDSSSTTDANRLEKGSILQETVEKLKSLREQITARDVQEEEVSSSQSVLPKEILGSLVLEALDGFMFIVKSDGKIDFVSDNVKDFLGFPQDLLSDKVIYNYIHQGDHARFKVNLEPGTWKTWKRIPQNRRGRQVFDRSKVFHVRFRLNDVAKREDKQDAGDKYENMQVSAIVMLNPIEEQTEDPKSGLFCIARKLNVNERSELTPVEQFTTKAGREDFVITVVDTSGLPELYVKNIESRVLGKTLLDLVHPHDVPLLQEHIKELLATESDTSKVYRMVLPPPHNVVHVKTKSRVFTPQPGFTVPGYIMSTHAIIRDNELDETDLPGLRPQLRGMEPKELASLDQMVVDGQALARVDGQGLDRVTSPQVQSPLGSGKDKATTGSRPNPASNQSHRGFPALSSPIPSSSPNSAASPFSSEMKSELFGQLLSPASQSESKQQFPQHYSMSAPSPTNGGNELLKELLKPKDEKSKDSSDSARPWGTSRQSSTSDNVTLVGLLNERPKQEPPSELLKRLREPPRASPTTTRLAQLLQGTKRPSSLDEGPATKQTPSLEKLLDIRPDSRPIPPLPRKWSEVPQDKLPQNIVVDNRPTNNRNNNMGRARVLTSTQPSSSPAANSGSLSTLKTTLSANSASRVIQNTARTSPAETAKSATSESAMPNFDPSFNDASDFRDLMTDPVLMKILDTVLVDDSDSDQHQRQQKIQEIEQQLMWVEQSMGPSGVPSSLPGPMVPQSPSSQAAKVVTSMSSAPFGGVIRQGSQHQQRGTHILQPRGPQGSGFAGGPRSPAPNLQPGTSMEELLKGVPPNVAIKNISDQQAGLSMRGMERQMSSPTPTRHLSGDQPNQGYGRGGRHPSGEQALGPLRRASGDAGLARQLAGGYTLVDGGPPPGRGGHGAMGPQTMR